MSHSRRILGGILATLGVGGLVYAAARTLRRRSAGFSRTDSLAAHMAAHTASPQTRSAVAIDVRPNAPVPAASDYDVSPTRGFLRHHVPLRRLPEGTPCDVWEAVVDDLGALLLTDTVRKRVDAMPVVDAADVLGCAGSPGTAEARVLERAFLVLGLLAHAYVFEGSHVGAPPLALLPPSVAVPWCQVAAALGRPPVITHSSMALANYRLLDAGAGPTLDNLAMNSLFLGSSDEHWFYTSTLAIEVAGAPALVALCDAMRAVAADSPDGVADALARTAAAVSAMVDALDALPRRCLPLVFYQRIRPFLAGWKGNAALPHGLTYAGVVADYDYSATPPAAVAAPDAADAFVGFFSGASAAQSSLVQALDAGLGCDHASDFLVDMRKYMPRPHAAFVDALRSGPSIAAYAAPRPALAAAHAAVLARLADFRSRHIQIVTRYILQQAPRAADADAGGEKGTGGTDIIPFLQGIRNSTRP